MSKCGKGGCACAIYPTFHDDPKLGDFYPVTGLEYETRGDGLTEVRVTTQRPDREKPVRLYVRPGANPVRLD